MTHLQIAFQGISVSNAVVADIQSRLAALERSCQQIVSCRVAVGLSHARHRQGNLFQVRLDLRLPGHEIVVRSASHRRGAYEDVYVVLRDVFGSARRGVEEYMRRRRVYLPHSELLSSYATDLAGETK